MFKLRTSNVICRRLCNRLRESHDVAPRIPLMNATIGIALQQAVEKTPDKIACVFTKQKIRKTYAELLKDVDRLSASLRQVMKLEPGDRIGVWGSNSYEWFLSQFATARCGLVMVNLNPMYRQAELEFALKKTGCKALIASTNFRTLNYIPVLQSIFADGDKSAAGTVASVKLPALKHLAIISEKQELGGAYRFADLSAYRASADEIAAIHNLQKKLDAHDAINIQFTSGTTGVPKGAMLTHHNIVNTANIAGYRLGYHQHETRILTHVPFYHCFAMIGANSTILAHGTTIVVPDLVYNSSASLEAIESERCTAVYGTPTMFVDMLNHPHLSKFDLSSLRIALFGGAPAAAPLLEKTAKFARRVLVGYGLTESSAALSLTPAECTQEQNNNTIGVLLNNTEAKIVDDNGATLPAGQRGELWIRGFIVMKGYWDEPAKTKEALTEDGWFKTGDLGVIRPDGFLQIAGRKKDMAIRGGENVYPAEVEQAIHGHPDVADVQVIGVPDERMGEEICAFIKLKDASKKLETEEIRKWLQEKIARFKIPRYVIFCSEFPTTVTGKVQKYKLREEAIKILKLEKVTNALKY